MFQIACMVPFPLPLRNFGFEQKKDKQINIAYKIEELVDSLTNYMFYRPNT